MGDRISKENAKEMGAIGGRRSAEVRAARRAMRGDKAAREKFEQLAPAMADILSDAARGVGAFSTLSPKDRAQFAVKALEYGMGRARAMEAEQAPVSVEPQQSGVTFATREPDPVPSVAEVENAS